MQAKPVINFLLGLLIACAGITSNLQAQELTENLEKSADVLVLHKIRVGADQVGNLAFLNLETREVVFRIPVGREPHEVAISFDGKYALAANTGANSNPGNTLSLIDVAARKELKRVDLGPLWSPHGVYYANGLFYFTAEGSRAIGAYDPERERLVWIMGTGQDTTHNLVVSKDGKTIFTANRGSDSVNLFQLKGDSPLEARAWESTIIPVCGAPQGLDLAPDGKTLWVGCRRSNEIAVVDAETKKVTRTFPTHSGQLARVRFTLDGKRVLLADLGYGELTIWDAATFTELKRIKLGSYAEGILMIPGGKLALVGVTTDDNVAVIDLDKMEDVGRIKTGIGPDGMAWIGRE